MAVIILARSNQNYPSVALMSQGGFWSQGSLDFWFPILTVILDLSLSTSFHKKQKSWEKKKKRERKEERKPNPILYPFSIVQSDQPVTL
jgi:hypothetical protein